MASFTLAKMRGDGESQGPGAARDQRVSGAFLSRTVHWASATSSAVSLKRLDRMGSQLNFGLRSPGAQLGGH